MEMLLDAITRMPDASTNQDLDIEKSIPIGSNGEGLENGNGEIHTIEVQSNRRKRQRRLSQAQAVYQCRICQRTYERADRLSRHQRTHENARRYLCQRCEKSFNRADLLTRHMMTHNRHDANYGPGHVGIQRSDRVSQACTACAAAKARCEDQKPCRRCQTKNITCEVTTQTSSGTRRQLSGDRRSQSCSTGSVSPIRSHTALESTIGALRQQQEYSIDNYPTIEPQPSASIENQQSNLHVTQIANHNFATEQEVIPPASVEPVLSQLEVYDSSSVPIDMSQHVFDNIMNEILFIPNATDFNSQILDVNLYDFTFQDEEFDAFAGPSIESNNNEGTLVEGAGRAPRSARDVRAGYAAFTRSPWLWTPAQRDCVLRDEENLALDEGSIFSALTPPSGPTCIVPSCGFPTIKPRMRDKMYHLVSTMNNYTNCIPDFPSLNVLNHIVEAFFARQTYQIDNWIHVPSMSLLDVIPELGLALVVAGSTVISVPAVWKMGLVLYDVVRVKLGELVIILIMECHATLTD